MAAVRLSGIPCNPLPPPRLLACPIHAFLRAFDAVEENRGDGPALSPPGLQHLRALLPGAAGAFAPGTAACPADFFASALQLFVDTAQGKLARSGEDPGACTPLQSLPPAPCTLFLSAPPLQVLAPRPAAGAAAQPPPAPSRLALLSAREPRPPAASGMEEPPFSFTNPGYAQRGVAPQTKTTLRGTFYSSAPATGTGATKRVDGGLLTAAGAYHVPAAADAGAPDPSSSVGGAVSAAWTAASREDGAASELRRVRWQPQTAAAAPATAAPHKAAAPPPLDAALLLSQSIEGIAAAGRAASASVADSGSASDPPPHWEDVTIDLRPGAPPRTGNSPSGSGEVGDDVPFAGRSQGVGGSAYAEGPGGGGSDEYHWQ